MSFQKLYNWLLLRLPKGILIHNLATYHQTIVCFRWMTLIWCKTDYNNALITLTDSFCLVTIGKAISDNNMWLILLSTLYFRKSSFFRFNVKRKVFFYSLTNIESLIHILFSLWNKSGINHIKLKILLKLNKNGILTI